MESHSNTVAMPFLSRSQDLAGMSMNSSLMSVPFPTDTSNLNSYNPQPSGNPNPLEQWYNRNDGPWIPKNLAPTGGQDGLNGQGHTFMFSGTYRESISPSECETSPQGFMLSDSGYGSRGAKQSIATASIYEDTLDAHETQSLAQGLSNLQWGGHVQAQAQMANFQRAIPSDSRNLVCETCQKTMRTNSELKKHQQRHTKPHMCNVDNCARTEGFSTSNDLDRHKRSVHPAENASGNRYRCTHGSCKNKEKVWPRADNFRAHIKRCHREIADEDVEKFIHRTIAPQDMLPDIAGMQPPSVGYQFNLSDHFSGPYWHGEMNSEVPTDASQNQSPAHQLPNSRRGREQTTARQPNDIVGVANQVNEQRDNLRLFTGPVHQTDLPQHPSSNPSSIQSIERRCEQQFVTPGELNHHATTASRTTTTHGKDEVSARCHTRRATADASNGGSEGVTTSKSYTESAENASSDSSDFAMPTAEDVCSQVLKLRDPEEIKRILEALQTNGLLEGSGYKKETTPNVEQAVSETTFPRQEGQNCCSACHKSFIRRCELKKHMKRHEKPYGCTYEGCNKRFGSKNDWKRHENSQHFLLEVWKCDYRAPNRPTEVCGKVSHRRETFRQHLVNSHHLTSDGIEKKLEECRVGRNCEANFWCGFCEEIIKIKGKGLDAWTERYNHIDDHLAGRSNLPKKQMDEWKSVDPDTNPHPDQSFGESEHHDSSVRLAENDRQSSTNEISRDDEQVAGAKRKSYGLGSGLGSGDRRHNKRPRRIEVPTTRCCECGEGNTRMGMNPQCINSSCQHELCNDCV